MEMDDKVLEQITFPRLIMCVSGIGVILLNFKVRREGFLFFALSATLWAIYDIRLHAYEQAATMVVSTLLSIMGYIRWGKKER